MAFSHSRGRGDVASAALVAVNKAAEVARQAAAGVAAELGEKDAELAAADLSLERRRREQESCRRCHERQCDQRHCEQCTMSVQSVCGVPVLGSSASSGVLPPPAQFKRNC